MNNPFENKAIKFATEQELNHLAELATGYGLDVRDINFENTSCRCFRISTVAEFYSNFMVAGGCVSVTYSDFIASLNHTEQAPDMVNHPPHYTVNGIEVIDIIDAFKLNYRLGNVVKYVLRADLKGNRLQDLKKALWYLQREIDNCEKETI
jgi:hypothetical protein